jgi:hypothetical protein
LLVCDDIVDVHALHSRIARQRVIDYFHDNLMNLLEPDGRFWGLYTPWHTDDLNARLKKNGAYSLFRAAVGPNLEPVWEEKWPAERLLERKSEIGSLSFARGYLLQPVANEGTAIRPEWVRFWNEPPGTAAGPAAERYEEIILCVDPAVSTSETADRSAIVVLGKCGRTPTVGEGVEHSSSPRPRLSPACSGRAARLTTSHAGAEMGEVGGASPPGEGAARPGAGDFTQLGSGTLGANGAPQIHVLAARAARLAAPDLVALIDHLDHVWNPSVIVFESNAAFLGMRDLLVRHTSFGPKIKGVTQTSDKAARIAAFSVVVENGAFRLLGDEHAVDASQRELYEEMIGFPFVDLNDLVDAAATGTTYLLTRREPMIW